ncbi:hypothetical protein D910_05790 [Dendroctonus ponderosae]|uniref:Uncharacterized protein n=1 Tax=Dendroctonus ponderosae TaxID=77166 RepID=U4U3E9_DENPD|nr:hypothetical protein D910_05790 [Dendroctonus ponderosae]
MTLVPTLSTNHFKPVLNRSVSRKEIIKNYIKKETANFFGVDEENEDDEQKRWFDRRKRMAFRAHKKSPMSNLGGLVAKR